MPGMLAGILVAVIAVGIYFALTGGSGQIAVQSSGADSAVNKESINKLSVLEQYLDRYYYKSSEITKEAFSSPSAMSTPATTHLRNTRYWRSRPRAFITE